MTEAQIKAAITDATARRAAALRRACRANAKAMAAFRETLASIQSQCRHRKVHYHSGYEMPSYYDCDVCGKEFSELPKGAKLP